jgi:dipeptidase D
MPDPLAALEPRLVWSYFAEICKIPHGSRDERALGEAVVAWSAEHGCEASVDEVGNVVIRIGATPGYESAPTVVLQGHLDMVCEKNSDKQFDFEKDAIRPLRDGDWITADGTTLGADNGIGVSMGLALMQMPEAVHGPLELLFTVDEESGLKGAINLKPGLISGQRLINLDSEEDGVFYVGCAGGRDTSISLPITREPATPGHSFLRLELKGLRGGHSGLDIVQRSSTWLRSRAATSTTRSRARPRRWYKRPPATSTP